MQILEDVVSSHPFAQLSILADKFYSAKTVNDILLDHQNSAALLLSVHIFAVLQTNRPNPINHSFGLN